MIKLSKDKRDKLISVCIATGGVIALLNFFLIGTRQDMVADYAIKIRSVRTKVDKSEALIKLLPRIQATLAADQKALVLKEDAMAPSAPSAMFQWFDQLVPPVMKAHHVRMLDCTKIPVIGPAELLPNFTYKAATFTVRASAHFEDFGQFVADFENSFPYMRVQLVSLRPLESQGATDNSSAPAPGSDRRPESRATFRSSQESPDQLTIVMKIITLVRPAS